MLANRRRLGIIDDADLSSVGHGGINALGCSNLRVR